MNIARYHLLIFALGFGLAAGARADLMRPLSVEELSQKSDLIVHGTVLNQTSLRDDSGRIYTKIELNASEVWKGSVTNHPLIIVHGGGTVGDERVEVSGQAEYAVGEEIVAFLVVNTRGEGVSIGLSQGKFHVWKDASGEPLAQNTFHGRAASATNAPAAISGRRGPPIIGRLTVADLKRRATGGAQ